MSQLSMNIELGKPEIRGTLSRERRPNPGRNWAEDIPKEIFCGQRKGFLAILPFTLRLVLTGLEHS